MCVSLPTAQLSKSEDYRKLCAVSHATEVNYSVLWVAFFFFKTKINEEGDVFVELIWFSVCVTQGVGCDSIMLCYLPRQHACSRKTNEHMLFPVGGQN